MWWLVAAGKLLGHCLVSSQLLLSLRECCFGIVFQRHIAKGSEVLYRDHREWQHDDATQHCAILPVVICIMQGFKGHTVSWLHWRHICIIRLLLLAGQSMPSKV